MTPTAAKQVIEGLNTVLRFWTPSMGRPSEWPKITDACFCTLVENQYAALSCYRQALSIKN